MQAVALQPSAQYAPLTRQGFETLRQPAAVNTAYKPSFDNFSNDRNRSMGVRSKPNPNPNLSLGQKILDRMIVWYQNNQLIHGFYKKIGLRCPYKDIGHPSCSQYGREAIDKYGFFKGGFMTTLRVLSCTPWTYGKYESLNSVA